MSGDRRRKEAAKRLGIAIHQRYENLVNASGEGDDAITVATVDLATVMYENVEFVIWALKKMGGLNPPPPEEIKHVDVKRPVPAPANDLPTLPDFLAGSDTPAVEEKCTCEVLEHGIIGRDKHMTSCPLYAPV